MSIAEPPASRAKTWGVLLTGVGGGLALMILPLAPHLYRLFGLLVGLGLILLTIDWLMRRA